MSSGKKNALINLCCHDGCEGSPSNPIKYNNQDYMQLKSSLLEKELMFVDSTFPPNSCSLGDLPFLNNWEEDDVEWLRPAEILKRRGNTEEITFCRDGTSRFDFGQGNISNCWFLAALSSLTFSNDLMSQVVPMNQSFLDYAGIFHFRFWRYGKWMDVVIDDLLPTMQNKLLSVYNKGGNELWVPLLEKAYAKVCGSYADMNFGLPSEACKDFTGGVSMIYPLKEACRRGHDEDLWQSLSRATNCMSMICCGTPPKGNVVQNTVSLNGLVDAHAYSVTAVTEVTYLSKKVRLVRIFNPWGQQEWNGDWSDRSPLWNNVSPEDKQKRYYRNDGEFWMELEDFCHNFAMLSISSENPNFLDGDVDCQWKCMIFEGSWVAGKSAGGNMNEVSFETNPQYRINVTMINEMDPGDKNVLISLLQKPGKKRNHSRFYPVAVTIVKIPPGTPEGWLELPFFYMNKSVKEFEYYTYDRELTELHSLEPGEYVIIPHTRKPYMTADFLLTVYTKSEAKIIVHEKHDHCKHDDKPKIAVNGDSEENPIHALFMRYADQNGELDGVQLQKALNENFPHGSAEGFSLDVCRAMSAQVDTENRMSTSVSEFTVLWEKMMEHKKVFHLHDLNESGALSDYELKKAIESLGIDVDSVTVKRLMFRYSDRNTTSLTSFIALMTRLEKTSRVFKDKAKDGSIQMNWSEWSNASMYS